MNNGNVFIVLAAFVFVVVCCVFTQPPAISDVRFVAVATDISGNEVIELHEKGTITPLTVAENATYTDLTLKRKILSYGKHIGESVYACSMNVITGATTCIQLH